MRVRFEMSGGYGGLFSLEPLTAEVDSEALPEAERDEFLRMARAAMASTPLSGQSDSTADLMTYRLQIDDDDRWEAVLDDRTVGEDVWPLINHLRAIAVQSRMGND